MRSAAARGVSETAPLTTPGNLRKINPADVTNPDLRAALAAQEQGAQGGQTVRGIDLGPQGYVVGGTAAPTLRKTPEVQNLGRQQGVQNAVAADAKARAAQAAAEQKTNLAQRQPLENAILTNAPNTNAGQGLMRKRTFDVAQQDKATGVQLAREQMASTEKNVAIHAAGEAAGAAAKAGQQKIYQAVTEKLPGKDGGTVTRIVNTQTGQFMEPEQTPQQDAWNIYTQGLKDQKRGWFNDKVLHAFGDSYSSEADKLLDRYWQQANPGVDVAMAPHRTGKVADSDVAQWTPRAPAAAGSALPPRAGAAAARPGRMDMAAAVAALEQKAGRKLTAEELNKVKARLGG